MNKAKLKSVIDTLATVAGIANPAIGAAIKAVNVFLPEDKKLPETATGADVASAIATLPPDIQMQLYSKEIDLEITESNNHAAIVKAMAEADGPGNTTRPYIALMMAWCIVAQVVAVFLAIVMAAFDDTAGILALKDNWEFILVTLATPAALLRSYFGQRTEEKLGRYSVLGGGAVPERKGLLAGLIK